MTYAKLEEIDTKFGLICKTMTEMNSTLKELTANNVQLNSTLKDLAGSLKTLLSSGSVKISFEGNKASPADR